MLDNGKIRVSVADEFPLIEIYHDGDLALADVEWVRHAVLHELLPAPTLPLSLIIDRQGSYSLQAEAYVKMADLFRETDCVAYVIHSVLQASMVQLARDSYLAGKRVASFHSVEQARTWLRENATEHYAA